MSEKSRTQYSQIIRESRYMYWGALLTINGILLSVFSAIYLLSATGNHLLILLLVLFSVFSCWLIVWSFLKTKELYEQIFDDYEIIDTMTEKILHETIEKRISESGVIVRIESIVQSFLFIEMFILLLILLR